MLSRLRPLGAGLLAGGALGVLIGGVGARLVMRAVALADEREDFGLRTSSGATVGDITAEGTLAVLGSGLSLGLIGGFVYAILRRWLPSRPAVRSGTFAALVVGFGLFVLVRSNEEDFSFVPPLLTLVLFGALLLLYGLLVPLAADRLAPPRATEVPPTVSIAAVAVSTAVLAGLTASAVVRVLELSPG